MSKLAGTTGPSRRKVLTITFAGGAAAMLIGSAAASASGPTAIGAGDPPADPCLLKSTSMCTATVTGSDNKVVGGSSASNTAQVLSFGKGTATASADQANNTRAFALNFGNNGVANAVATGGGQALAGTLGGTANAVATGGGQALAGSLGTGVGSATASDHAVAIAIASGNERVLAVASGAGSSATSNSGNVLNIGSANAVCWGSALVMSTKTGVCFSNTPARDLRILRGIG